MMQSVWATVSSELASCKSDTNAEEMGGSEAHLRL